MNIMTNAELSKRNLRSACLREVNVRVLYFSARPKGIYYISTAHNDDQVLLIGVSNGILSDTTSVYG